MSALETAACAVAVAAAVAGAVVALTIEREAVARRNYLGAQAAARTARSIWLAALWRAVQLVGAVALLLGCLYLVRSR